ncbi:MAG: EamA family transporter [Actinobacteria bacterium]|nr:EamA family transporter [Actinomycetota bacterium]
MDSSGKLEYLMIAGAAVIWGTVGVFLRWVDVPGQEYFVVFMRGIISLSLLTVIIFMAGTRDKLHLGKHPVLLLFSGALLTFHWVMLMRAMNMLTIGDAVFITYLSPVLVAALAPLLLKEKLEGATVLALLLALAGMYLISMTGQTAAEGLNGTGILYALAAAASYALLLIILKVLREDTPTLTITFYQEAMLTILLLPFCAFRDFGVSPKGWASLLVLGAVHTTLAALIFIYAVKRVKAQHVGIIAYLEPLSAVVFGLIFLGEQPGWQDLVGGLLIIAAGAVVLRRGLVEAGVEEPSHTV